MSQVSMALLSFLLILHLNSSVHPAQERVKWTPGSMNRMLYGNLSLSFNERDIHYLKEFSAQVLIPYQIWRSLLFLRLLFVRASCVFP
jgi:hypothetical protein